MKKLMGGGHFSQVFQSFLMSATMTKDVQSLKGLVLRDPVSLVSHFFFSCLIFELGNPGAGSERR